ncbi:MAG: hypothetical protein HKO81_00760 [Flavobacteriaceae bacterium]|nr:hypothetical protein [Bacteroidia bacterium]NNL15154.1 hypothetical protein [Flavobacteriaceae bacterium]
MIKFFRKIRYGLIEKNKTGKYLKYAIGEILLVVIGILIALGINNWNENRKLRNQEIIYLDNLKNDINSQIQMLDVYIEFEDIIIDQTKDIIKHYELNDGFNNMDSIYPKLHDLTIRWTFSNANTTLMQLLNSNQINIIQNRQLKEDLIAYNQQIDLFTKNTNINNTNLVDNFTTQTFIEIGSYAFYGNSKRMVKKFNDFYSFETKKVSNSELKNISTQFINEPKIKLELINKVVYRNTLSSLQKSGNLGLKERSEQILLMIEKEIETHK